MTSERWQQINELYHAALELDANEQVTFLNQACAGDAELRAEVESLIASHERAGSFIVEPAMKVAARVLAEGQATSLVGRSFSHYRIESLLGVGGMGEVYLAQDTRLGRQVALKLLPTHLSGDSDRLRRFEQEARVASSLNHPNVCMIHEVGEMEDGRHYIVMEYIEGVTLRERLASKSLKLREALDAAVQAASALEAAHAAGVVHRDIKPENIMLRRDGYLKVLDFGLAKLTERFTERERIEPEAPTRGMVKTDVGVVMGTVAYMSPEQTRGQDIDARTDIWSLGVVVYEMVTGRVPFEGATNSDLIVSILEREPKPLIWLLPKAPAELQRIISKALRKDREERYQGIKDLRLDLKSLKQELDFEAKLEQSVQPDISQQTKEVQVARTTLSAEFPNRKPLRWTAGILGGLLLLAAGAWYLSRLITKPKPTQPALTAVPLTTDPGFEGMPSLSPDGNQVAYASGGPDSDNFDIYVKQIGGGPARRLTSDRATDEFPAWSPDGRSIAFIRDRGDKLEVLLIPSLGGPERKVADTAADTSTYNFSWVPPYLAWTPDSKYLVTADGASPGEPLGLFVLSVATGEQRRLTTPPAKTLADGNPAISPDGRTLAFVRVISTGTPQLFVLRLSEDYQSGGVARRLDLAQPWVTSPAWTADGREIVCGAGQPWGAAARLWRIMVSGPERAQPIASVGDDVGQPTISRQGDRLVYAHWTGDWNIWRTEIAHSGTVAADIKLIASTRRDTQPQYSADGSRIVFATDRSGHNEIWLCEANGSNPVQLTSMESTAGSPFWFPDGKRIVFDCDNEGHREVCVMDNSTLVPRRLMNEASDNMTPSVSHDGRWVYFVSRRTGKLEVWRMPAEGGDAVQVTRQGGDSSPLESVDGNIVYYHKDQGIWKVPVTGGEETRVIGPIAGNGTFAVTSKGIYFIEIGTQLYVGSMGNSLKFFSFAKGSTEKVADVKLNPQSGLSISPDGRYAVFDQLDPFVSDLMLVDNFR